MIDFDKLALDFKKLDRKNVQEIKSDNRRGTCNTPTANYKNEILSHGLDYLKIGFYGVLDSNVLEEIKELKDIAQDPKQDDPVHIVINNYKFRVMPHGGGNYSYIIANDAMNIAFTEQKLDKEGNPAYPNIMLTLGSTILWKESADGAYNLGRNCVIDLVKSIDQEKVSRADLCVDITGKKIHKNFTDMNISKDFVTRARDKTARLQHDEVTGYSIGSRGSKVCSRIYNKSQEIKIRKNKKAWFYDIWGIDQEKSLPVWRVEFEVHRSFFSKYAYEKDGEKQTIETYHDLKVALFDLWKYLTVDWFSIRKKNQDSNTSRCPLYDFWQMIDEMDSFQGQKEKVGAVRIKTAAAGYRELLMGAKGYVTSMITSLGINEKTAPADVMNTFMRVVGDIKEVVKKHLESDISRKSSRNQLINSLKNENEIMKLEYEDGNIKIASVA